MWAGEALERFAAFEDVKRVLDIGSGDSPHASILREAGKDVETCDIKGTPTHLGDYMEVSFGPRSFDGIWCSHVLEHQPNVQVFLHKLMFELRPEGVLAITVPPAKHQIVGGHLTLWNQGLLVYNLVVAGLDCREALVSPLYAGYNLSVIVRNKRRPDVVLKHDAGDIETLAPWFPFPVEQGFRGDQVSVGW